MEMQRREFLKFAGAMTFTLAAGPSWAQSSKIEVQWLGQAATKISRAR